MQSATAADKIVTEEVRLEPEVQRAVEVLRASYAGPGRRRSWCLARVWARWRTHSTQPFLGTTKTCRVSLHQAWLDMPVPWASGRWAACMRLLQGREHYYEHGRADANECAVTRVARVGRPTPVDDQCRG